MSCTQQDLTINNKLHCDYGTVGTQESTTVGDFQIQEDLVRYLDSSGQLEKIEENVQKYRQVLKNAQDNSEVDPPCRLLVDIDFLRLADVSGYLADALLDDPLGIRRSLHGVVLHATRALGDMPRITHDQVEVSIRLRSLPKYRRVCNADHGLGVLQGVLMARTTIKKYIRSTLFSCPSEVCGNSLGSRVPGYSVDKKLECSECGLYLVEDARARVMGDHVVGVIIDAGALQFGAFNRYQGVHVSFQDDMTDDLELGVHYDITGYRGPNIFHAWSLSRWLSQPASQILHGMSVKLPASVEALRKRLKNVCPDSPWAFVAILVSQLGHHLVPLPTFLNIKMGLLLSLASLGGSCPVPVLAVGTDGSTAHSLLLLAAQLAPRSLAMPLCLPIGGTEKGDDGTYWSEAGALLLARSGVCYLGDWAKFRLASHRAPILAAVESKTVTLHGPGLTPGPAPASSFPLKTAVWTYWPQNPRTDSLPANQTQLKTLVHVFGMPYLADAGTKEEDLVRHILQSAIDGGNRSTIDSVIPQNELKEFIEITIAQPMQLGERASELIQDYFVASRRVRPDCLPVGAVGTITALSEAHARLSLRNTVNCADVLAVLFLYEETIASTFGQSYMTPPPSRDLYDPTEVDARMGDFAQWLEQYIKSILGDGFLRLGSQQ